jgi:hypothetical protein
MRCPYCNSKKINVIKEDLIVADDPDATGGRTSNKCLIYDESILHYECENKHIFFGAIPLVAQKNAEMRKGER